MDNLKIGMISLGCDKNRIDSEIILNQLKSNYEIVNRELEAEIIIINTCGFIESAKEESINTILEMAKYKTEGNCKILAVTGCLSQRYGNELIELIPEIDILIGVNNYSEFTSLIDEFLCKKEKIVRCNFSDKNINVGERIITTNQRTAYIRISEGCDNNCTYCIIPKIRGKYRSRNIESIVKEAESLVVAGVRELIIIAQDTTSYGIDLYGKKMLPLLLESISSISELKWIRLLYCYPEEITDTLIKEIKMNKKICKYIDIPIQHISDNILKRMGRRGKKSLILSNINKLRESIPELIIRTSIIVGFPGEAEEDFLELKEFIESFRFDKLGVFKYSQEEGTPAAYMEDQIDEEIKNIRYEEIMSEQQKVSKMINKSKIGKIYTVIVEEKNGINYWGRSFEMAPEIDGQIAFKSKDVYSIGDFISVRITEAYEYDLIGVVYNESGK